MLKVYQAIEDIAQSEFKDIISKVEYIRKRTIGSAKLRIIFKNNSFLDIWLSETGKYSFHWEARAQTGKIYRHDNAPDFPEIKTFPKHFHDGDEKTVKPSNLPDAPEKAIRETLKHIRSNFS